MLIRVSKGWEIPEREATPEHVYRNRREILRAAGFLGAAAILPAQTPSVFAAKRNPEFTLDRPITEEWAATGYNNFYEFHPTDKEAVRNLVGKFETHPWTVDVTGLVAKPVKLDLDDLLKRFPHEERLYRFRCVEAWSMAVPWVGFPLSELVKTLAPKPEAKFIRFVTVHRPSQMPGMRMPLPYKWPYYEGLRMDEAMNPLTMVVTGMYGKELPKQNGAPIRIIVPWKYGYKSIKSIVTMDFTSRQPPTFWNDAQGSEYGFYSNVDPSKPHPRWSQRFEKVIPRMTLVKTLPYNGYEKYVAGMYNGREF
jgi:sulfoxide reductase catalytic subunit YedY